MATLKQPVGSRTSVPFTGTALSALASGTYVRSTNPITFNTNQPTNAVLEVNIETSNTPTGNKQVLVFFQESLNGTEFQSGPSSGTDAARESSLTFLGFAPILLTATPERYFFDLVQKLGHVPHSGYPVLKNDLGVALTAGTVFVSEINPTST